jgi:hypothetical protein
VADAMSERGTLLELHEYNIDAYLADLVATKHLIE